MLFCPEISDYKQFYATGLGRQVRASITKRLLHLWPELSGDTLLGLGYALPYLKPYMRQNKGEILAMMGADQGAVYWPRNQANLCALVDWTNLPIRDAQMNRVLAVHALEYCDDPTRMLQEIWRVLTPGGRALIVVPNRRSGWARSEQSLFSHGYPYRVRQLRSLAEEGGFTTVSTDAAMFFPPWGWKGFERLMPSIDSFGQLLLPQHLGGVIILNIEKQLYAKVGQPAKSDLLKGVYAPAGKPAMTRAHHGS